MNGAGEHPMTFPYRRQPSFFVDDVERDSECSKVRHGRGARVALIDGFGLEALRPIDIGVAWTVHGKGAIAIDGTLTRLD